MKTYPFPQACPVCESKLVIQELKCNHCQTTIRGNFSATRLASLTEEQLRFVEIFLKVRGNIKEMERELGISYPTVRNRLEQVIEALGYKGNTAIADKNKRQQILDQLENGEISSEEALKLLKDL